MIDPENENTPETADVKSPTKNTRLLDNHYDPKIHEKPWISPGHLKDYKYEYSASGLGFVMGKQKKMKNFKERHEQIKEIEELNKKSRGFRHFREYDNVCNNEILITIEYCTNCRQHQGSTRHDEEKYAYFANTLKKEIITQYPVIKVVLKPLIFELNDESTESIYLRSRLGAFEVQLFSKNNKGEPNKRYIFSKLRTRAWPAIPTVVENIASSLPTDDFVVRLVDLNYNSEEMKEENENQSGQNKTQASKLKGLHVVLRPYRSGKKSVFGSPELAASGTKGMNDSSRITMTGASRPQSGVMRPQSAYSVTSSKSTMSMKKSLSPTGPEEKNVGKEYVEASDVHGVVVFKKVPHNIYEIELLETHNYLPEKRTVNIFELIERGAPLKEDLLLKEQTMGFCILKLTENRTPFSDASIIVAKKNPEPNSKTAVLREKDPKSGLFEFMIDPGEYILSISKAGFGERKEEITATRGTNEFAFELGDGTTQARSPERQQIPIKAEERPNTGSRQRPPSSKGRHEQQGFSASKGNNKGNLEVIPQENHESSPTKKDKGQAHGHQQHHGHPGHPQHQHDVHEEPKQKERVKSALVKKVEFSVLDIDSGKPVIGVAVMLDEIGFKGTTNEQGKCLVPVNKLNNGKLVLDHEHYFGMVEEYGDDGIDLKGAAEKKFSLIPRPHDMHEVQFRFLPGNGAKCAKFSVLYDQADESSKKDIVVRHSEGGKELITCKNLLKKHGVFRIVADIIDMEGFFHPESMFILSHYADCDQLYIFPPAERLLDSEKLVWDAGFFADPVTNPQFVEINGYSTIDITLYSSLREYQMLLNYLHHSKSDLKTLLGFKEKNRIEKEGDIFISKDTIYASLDKYGLEIKNVDHLLSSACTPEGLYSFRECERRFAGLRPPFNFVKDQKSNKVAAGLEEGDDDDDDEDEEEYLFEDEK